LAIDHRQALEFFVLRLQDVSEPTVDRQKLNRVPRIVSREGTVLVVPPQTPAESSQ
jgi:hypothetical protein